MIPRRSPILLAALAAVLTLASPAVLRAGDPTKPVPGGVRWFMNNHRSNLQKTKTQKFDLCFLGDSITAMWPGDQFNKHFGKYKPANFGIGGDRTENVLWRLDAGELKGTSPKVIVLLIGTNNAALKNSDEEIAKGVKAVIDRLQKITPKSKILLLGILPSRKPEHRARTEAANVLLAKLDDGKTVRYLDIGPKMLDKDGKLLGGVLADDVHLTPKGYVIWAEAMNPLLTEMMKP